MAESRLVPDNAPAGRSRVSVAVNLTVRATALIRSGRCPPERSAVGRSGGVRPRDVSARGPGRARSERGSDGFGLGGAARRARRSRSRRRSASSWPPRQRHSAHTADARTSAHVHPRHPRVFVSSYGEDDRGDQDRSHGDAHRDEPANPAGPAGLGRWRRIVVDSLMLRGHAAHTTTRCRIICHRQTAGTDGRYSR